MTLQPGDVAPPTEEAQNPLLATPTSGQDLTKALSPLSSETPFERRFDALFRDIIMPALLKVVNERRAFPTFNVEDLPGPVERADNEYFVDNKRVILRVGPFPASLWFVAWAPFLLVQQRRGVGGPLDIHRLEEITSEFVERVARDFVNSVLPE